MARRRRPGWPVPAAPRKRAGCGTRVAESERVYPRRSGDRFWSARSAAAAPRAGRRAGSEPEIGGQGVVDVVIVRVRDAVLLRREWTVIAWSDASPARRGWPCRPVRHVGASSHDRKWVEPGNPLLRGSFRFPFCQYDTDARAYLRGNASPSRLAWTPSRRFGDNRAVALRESRVTHSPHPLPHASRPVRRAGRPLPVPRARRRGTMEPGPLPPADVAPTTEWTAGLRDGPDALGRPGGDARQLPFAPLAALVAGERPFAHPFEQHFARLLNHYRIRWELRANDVPARSPLGRLPGRVLHAGLLSAGPWHLR